MLDDRCGNPGESCSGGLGAISHLLLRKLCGEVLETSCSYAFVSIRVGQRLQGFQYYPSYLRPLEERLNRRSVFRELRWSVSVERGEKWKHPRDWQCAFTASCKNGISFDELHRCLRTTPSQHRRVVLKKTLVATVVALLFLLSSEAILAVQRPPYPIKAEPPDAGRWVIISTNEKLR